MASLLDSSVWIALYRDQDVHHKQAQRLIRELRGSIYFPYCVLVEVASVLTYKHSKAQADKFLDAVAVNQDLIWIESESFEDAEFFRKLPSRISFTDATLLRLAKTLKAELVTFDRQLARLHKKLQS